MASRSYIWLVAGISLLILASPARSQDEQWLQYHSAREARRLIGDMGRQHPGVSSDKPAGVELPEFKCDKPLFVKWPSPMVKSGCIWIAFDRSHKHGPYDRLFIDSNGDGQLKDQTPTSPYQTEQNGARFGPVKLVFEAEDGPVSYHLNFEFYDWGEDRYYLRLSSGGWYEGSIMVGGEKKHCVLIDYNANGAFDDKSLNSEDCDRVRIGRKDDRDARFVGNYIEVEGVLYASEIARDGAYIKLTKAEDVTFGNIRMPETITEFAAGGENGLFTIEPEKGIGRLPVGKYRIQRWQIKRKDEKGDTWRLTGRRLRDKGDFEVTEAGQTSLQIGEPIRGRLRVRLRDEDYGFDKQLQGKLGEYVELTRNDKRVQLKMRVKNKDGTFDRTYALEDG